MTRSRRTRSSRQAFETMKRSAPGTPPGTLTLDPASPNSRMQVMTYGPDGLQEVAEATVKDITPTPAALTRWVNVDGLGDGDSLRHIAAVFALHPLAMEDVTSLRQRSKAEDYDSHLFVILHMPDGDASVSGQIRTEQVSLFLGRDFVLTFQEHAGDSFDPVRRRLRSGSGHARTLGAGYLAYALIDVTIDSYFPLLEVVGERLETLEEEVIARPAHGHIARIHELKHDLLTLRRAVWPMRDMLASLMRDNSDLFSGNTRLFLRDCHDHAMQLIDMIETYREIASSLIEIQLSSVSNRMNEVMKVLTIIATIFIPLTFIAGVYGMNFDPDASPWNMPELEWRYGYPAAMGGMLAIAVLLVFWFRHRGWIGPGSRGQ